MDKGIYVKKKSRQIKKYSIYNDIDFVIKKIVTSTKNMKAL